MDAHREQRTRLLSARESAVCMPHPEQKGLTGEYVFSLPCAAPPPSRGRGGGGGKCPSPPPSGPSAPGGPHTCTRLDAGGWLVTQDKKCPEAVLGTEQAVGHTLPA